MRLGLCAEPVTYALEPIRAGLPACELIRFDVYPDVPDTLIDEQIARVRGYGFTPLPILNLRYPTPTMDDAAIGAYAGWCGRVAHRNLLDVAEVLNEPRILGHWPPDWYRWTAEATCRVLRADSPLTEILLAGEMLQPDRKGPRPVSWWREATKGLDLTLFDGVAIHPYREPGPPDVSRIGGTCFGRGATRAKEYAWCREQAHGKPLWVTEVGWNLSRGVTSTQQADYLARELELADQAGVHGVCVYAAIGREGDPMNFGIWQDTGEQWAARPAVARLGAWREARP